MPEMVLQTLRMQEGTFKSRISGGKIKGFGLFIEGTVHSCFPLFSIFLALYYRILSHLTVKKEETVHISYDIQPEKKKNAASLDEHLMKM